MELLVGGGLLAFIQWAFDKWSERRGKKDKTAAAIEKLGGRIESLEGALEAKDARDSRTHILRFADELYNEVSHSQEYFNDILDDITLYEKYCNEHPEFPNAKTALSAKRIKETYERLHEEHKFL